VPCAYALAHRKFFARNAIFGLVVAGLLVPYHVTATRSFRVFETVATLTNGGPGFASDVLVFAMYREGFVYFKAGYSGAITMACFFFVLALTLTQLRIVEKRVHYR
jgi:multiple sugar transport system permease protein